jgi:hypothetical protein
MRRSRRTRDERKKIKESARGVKENDYNTYGGFRPN